MSPAVPPVCYARTPRGDIAFRVLGEGGLDLVLINPMSRSIELLWDYPGNARLLQRLARRCRVIVFDRRGSGISDPLPADLSPTWENWLDDLLAVLDHLGVSNAALLAERDGAAAALLFASSHPERVRALLLCNTSARFRVAPGYPGGENYERSERLSQQWEESWGTARMVAATRPTLAGDPAYVDWVTRMQRIAYSPRRAAAEFRYIINFDARAVLSSIRAPTLILHRRDFAVIPMAHAEYLAEHIKGARLERLPGSDMDVLLPGDDRPLELIEEFLASARPVRAGEPALTVMLRLGVAPQRQAAIGFGDAGGPKVLDRLRAMVRPESTRFQSGAIEEQADGFLISFDGPARALRFASAVRQMARDQLHVEIRVGLHIGECGHVGDALTGVAVDIATAVLRVAQAGEVLVTEPVRELVSGSGIQLRGMDPQQLAGTAGTWKLYALEG